uniref:Poly(A) binding protein interacting protein 2 n=1 Tax=Sus scrofa TaxID=9823 RepID=A0A8D1KYI6_PIG
MKDPSRSSTSPSIINEDVIINGHSHEDDNPFAEYMWMENEEEFNRQIEEELWEEEFIERCFQEMLEEEEEHEWFIPARDLPQTMDQIQDQFNDLVISDGSSLEDLVVKKQSESKCKGVCSWGEVLKYLSRRGPLLVDVAQFPHCEGSIRRLNCKSSLLSLCYTYALPKFC